MATLESLAQTSTRKLTSLLNSNISYSLRMEVLINNLLSSLEKEEHHPELRLCNINPSHAPRNPSKLRFPHVADDSEEDTVDEDEQCDEDVPSPAYDEISEAEDDHEIRHSCRRILKRTRPIDEVTEESPVPQGHAQQRIDPYADFSIEVIDDSSLWSEEESASSARARPPLMLRIKLPQAAGEKDEDSETLSVAPAPIDPFEPLDPPEPLDGFDGSSPKGAKKRSIMDVEGGDGEGLDLVPQYLESSSFADEVLSSDADMISQEFKGKPAAPVSPKKKVKLAFDDRDQNRKP